MRPPRPAEASAAAAIAALYNHYVRESPATFDIEEKTVADRAQWLNGFAESGPYRAFVLEDEDGLAGFAYSSRFRAKPGYDRTIETTVYVDHERTGRGAGGTLYAALFDALKNEPLRRAVAGVVTPNPASVALHRRAGFRDIGVFSDVGWKFGRYWDVLWLEKPLTDE